MVCRPIRYLLHLSRFQNGADMPWWQGHEVTRLPEQNSWNLSIQRQLTGSLVLDLSYNGVAGSHLQSGVLNYNQVPFQYSQRFTNAQLGLRFNDPAQAAQIAALGVQLPYANFVQDFGSRATLAQALRPYPQYTDINTWRRQRRSQWPLVVSCGRDQAGEAVRCRFVVHDVVRVLENAHGCG